LTDFIQPGLAIFLVLGLLAASLYVLRRRGAISLNRVSGPSLRIGGNPRQLVLVEKLTLGPQHALHLVKAGTGLLLISTSPVSCQIAEPQFLEWDRAEGGER